MYGFFGTAIALVDPNNISGGIVENLSAKMGNYYQIITSQDKRSTYGIATVSSTTLVFETFDESAGNFVATSSIGGTMVRTSTDNRIAVTSLTSLWQC